jgi:RHS repeat-associated protein
VVAFLGVVLAVVVGPLGAAPASAAMTSTAQNGVGASDIGPGIVAGSSANISAGQRFRNDPPQDCGVAATAAVVVAIIGVGPVDSQSTNAQGSSTQGSSVLTASGGVVAADLALYGDFGDVLDGNPPATDTGFTGQSSVGGLLEFASRSYDPSSRTWLQSDSYPGTLARSSSQNAYAYVEGAPETFVDVLGFWRGADAFDAYLATLDGNNGKPFLVSAGEFVENHQGDIVGGLFTVGCTLATVGSGVLLCVGAGSAISASMNYIANTPAEDRTLLGLTKAVGTRVVVDVAATVALGGVGRVAAPLLRTAASKAPAAVRSTLSSALRSAADRLPATTGALRELASGLQQGLRPWAKNTVRELEVATVETANTGRIVAQDALRTAEAQAASTASEVSSGARFIAGSDGVIVDTQAAAANSAEAGSIRGVNPLGGNMNCVNCAVATDSTLAGNPASALLSGPKPISVLEDLYGGSFVRVAGSSEIEGTLANAGNGARGIVYASRADGVGHVFNAVNQGGTIRFLDGQTGGVASFAGYDGFWFLGTG